MPFTAKYKDNVAKDYLPTMSDDLILHDEFAPQNFLVIIVIWCSHYLPGVTDHSECYLFDEVDWEGEKSVRTWNGY